MVLLIMRADPIDSKIEGPLRLTSNPKADARGFFDEKFDFDSLKEAGFRDPLSFVNHSKSRAGVLRGLHIQIDPAQAKLVWVVSGSLFDVVIDLRPGSPTLGKYASVTLDAERPDSILCVPTGFAHGYCVTASGGADVVYLTSAPYNPKGETGILWSDVDLKIPWPIQSPILSEKDQNLPPLKKFLETRLSDL